jgi:hypothetical protein
MDVVQSQQTIVQNGDQRVLLHALANQRVQAAVHALHLNEQVPVFQPGVVVPHNMPSVIECSEC